MSADKFNSWGRERDFLCKGPSACLLWCVPWAAFALGFSVRHGLRTVLWATSLAIMGVACLVNASRCGRVHCRFTGPFFILGATYFSGLWPRLSAAWTIRMELDWPRNNHRSNRPHLPARTVSRSISVEWFQYVMTTEL